MRILPNLTLAGAGAVAALIAAPEAHAQRVRIAPTPFPQGAMVYARGDEPPRALIGIGTGGATGDRDTLGVLVTSVMRDSPAEKAGIEEGNRIAAVNGVNLRVAPADAGAWEVSNAMTHRLTRELGKLEPGADVELRVYAAGQTRTVKLKSVSSDALMPTRPRTERIRDDDRPTLGVTIGSVSSRRDTLGVLVLAVADSGPAALAGIEEGNRIAAINGVDLRVPREDAGDGYIAGAKVSRLQRELGRVQPGSDVELRVYANGQTRTVKVKAARRSDIDRDRHSVFITGDASQTIPFGAFSVPNGWGESARRAIEQALEGSRRAVIQLRDGVGGATIAPFMWHDDDDDSNMRMNEEAPRARGYALSTTPAATLVAADRARAGGFGYATFTPDAIDGRRDPGADIPARVGVDIDGLEMVPVDAELARYLGAGSDRGLLVTHAPAWVKRTLRAGDVVLMVDGRAVRESDDAISIDLPAHTSSRVSVIRDSTRRTIVLPARR